MEMEEVEVAEDLITPNTLDKANPQGVVVVEAMGHPTTTANKAIAKTIIKTTAKVVTKVVSV
jgi:hypothetical protein